MQRILHISRIMLVINLLIVLPFCKFNAAFKSRSILSPHRHEYMRSLSFRSFLISSHEEHFLEDGKKRSTFINSIPYFLHLYSIWRENSLNFLLLNRFGQVTIFHHPFDIQILHHNFARLGFRDCICCLVNMIGTDVSQSSV